MGKIVGRSDDMLIIRGVNVFPTQIEELVLQHEPAVGAVPARRHARTGAGRTEVRANCCPARARSRRSTPMKSTLQHRIKTLIGVSTTVDVLDARQRSSARWSARPAA
jgi:phenylacetate-CoA ligase